MDRGHSRFTVNAKSYMFVEFYSGISQKVMGYVDDPKQNAKKQARSPNFIVVWPKNNWPNKFHDLLQQILVFERQLYFPSLGNTGRK